ncbi:hypothetical protein PAAG_03002 [Paracoccidioides lutzii Pb01]|uniref:Vesicle-mediated transporter Vid24 n=1 Tax=Paracoccidioides lutzii (strain ATCC MYA-826 / Pb01) TaxID=502779 RepID=C1GY48_PARBA|nr:hypothetical protein PAAG_03002 [Paracoccidioides lutzii Pb01]EEH41439.1 hypothetical protein PAAG_03002 [Paracoccidioides lutzii Pb01]
MPTPSSNPQQLSTAYSPDPVSAPRPTCPPEPDRIATFRASSEERIVPNADDDASSIASASTPHSQSQLSQPLNAHSQTALSQNIEISSQISSQVASQKSTKADDDVEMMESLKPAVSVSACAPPPANVYPPAYTSSTTSTMDYEISTVRLLPNHWSSFLRAGSKFVGTQQSDRQIYNVDVEIKHVDMAEWYLCGYLRIQGLTEDHPTLTTFFEAEIIGTKYSFLTNHPSWGATDQTDLQHWGRFPAYRPIAKFVRKDDFKLVTAAQHPDIFMRWKECFLVPDHRVRTISGASFEGFYYICFNRVKGTVSGIYFHAKSEKYQQLELKHMENNGCFGAMEFR